MKRSASISLGLLTALALTVGCKKEPEQDVKACADKQGKIVEDSWCTQQPETSSGQNPHDDHLLRDLLLYRWVFGGNYSGGYVGGYSYYPSPSIIYVPPHSSAGSAIISAGSAHSYSVSRGGFGHSFGGGEGGE